MRADSQCLEHGEALETQAVVFTVHHILPTLTVVRGAGRVRDQLHKTGGETEAQGGEGTTTQSHSVPSAQGVSGTRSHKDEKRGRFGSEQGRQDSEKELTSQRQGAPGLAYITQHTCLPPHTAHVRANVSPSTAHTPGPHSLANEPWRLGPNKLD